jgi:hypothetical protein
MKSRNKSTAGSTSLSPPLGKDDSGPIGRRAALRTLGMAGVTAGAGFGVVSMALAQGQTQAAAGLSAGEVAILRFLAAAEIIESDLWLQYQELAVGNAPYANALSQLDGDMVQYVSDNTDDELSHAAFLNAYLTSMGAQPVNFDAFRTLPSSTAKGAAKLGRLTNLTSLTVDTSWWLRYRSPNNPDLGATFPQFLNIVNQPAIPLRDNYSADEIQAIANTAGFHFASIEQGGSSLYTSLLPQVTHPDVVRIVAGIGGTEVNHFAIWHDLAGNAPAVSVNGLVFPDFESFDGDEARQKNLIMPEPCTFLRADLPPCSVIRPASIANAGPVATIASFTADGLFKGQSKGFLDALNALAADAEKGARANVPSNSPY